MSENKEVTYTLKPGDLLLKMYWEDDGIQFQVEQNHDESDPAFIIQYLARGMIETAREDAQGCVTLGERAFEVEDATPNTVN